MSDFDMEALAAEEQAEQSRGRTLFGVNGIRDPEYPCAEYRAGAEYGTCYGDGHHMCRRCSLHVPTCQTCGWGPYNCVCEPDVPETASGE